MNPTATLNFLLDSKPVQVEPARAQNNSRVGESEFKGHLQARLNEGWQQGKQGKGVERNSRNAEQPLVKDASMTSPSGETLPLGEGARKFLAALEQDDRKALLEDLHSWLSSLNPEELNNLQQTLNENPESLPELLPEALQQLLAELTADQPTADVMLSGFGQLVQHLASADVEFSRVAGLQLQSGSDIKDIGRLKLDVTANIESTKGEQQGTQPERFADVISRLSRTDAAAVPGGDSLQQLLQAAGQGLQGVYSSTAAQGMTRLAAGGIPVLPMMTQAAAEANAQAVSNRISMMNAKNMQVAEMRLDPPHLGSIRVQIRMQGEMASVVFQAPNAHARDLLEQSLPHLRQMMEAEGLMLADAQVSEESFSGQDHDGEKSGSSSAGQSLAGAGIEDTAEQIPLLNQPLGLIDYYA